jgi:hypothetical protein
LQIEEKEQADKTGDQQSKSFRRQALGVWVSVQFIDCWRAEPIFCVGHGRFPYLRRVEH